MLKPSGHFLIVTPFMYKVHPDPIDCVRWTQEGLRYFLEDAGFSGPTITGSWGNRRCIEATFRREFRLYNRFLHPVDDEFDYPIVVWALAQTAGGSERGRAASDLMGHQLQRGTQLT
jgi:hypothetical protein